MLRKTAYTLGSAEGLRVAAVLPDPIGEGQGRFLTADQRWQALKLAVLKHGGQMSVARLRPPTARATLRFVGKGSPHVVYFDARVTDRGWFLEDEAGGEEPFDLEGVHPRTSGGPVLVSRHAIPQGMQQSALDSGCPAAVDLAEHDDDDDAVDALATILSALAGGAAVGAAVEAATTPEHFLGDAGCQLVSAPGSGRPRIIDETPPGTPEELPEDLWATDALVRIAGPLIGRSEVGAAILSGKRTGKTEYALATGRRLSHRFRDGILGMVPGHKISSLAELLEQAGRLLSLEPQAETIGHEIRRRRMLIFIDDCHRLDSDAAGELARFLGPIPPWCRSKLLLAGESVPRKLRHKQLATIDLGTGFDQETASQLGQVLQEKRPELDPEFVETATRRYRGNPELLKLMLQRADAFKQDVKDPSFLLRAFDGATELVGTVLPDSVEQYLVRNITSRYSDRISQAFDDLDEDQTRLFKLLTVFEAPPTYWLLQSFLAKLTERRGSVFDDDFDLDESLDELIDKGFVRVRDRRLRPNALFVPIADQLWKKGDTKKTEAVAALIDSCMEFRIFWGSDVQTVKQQLPNLMFALEQADRRTEPRDDGLAEYALYLYRYQLERGSYRESRNALEVAAKHAPESRLLELKLKSADLYRKCGEDEKAADAFREIAEIAPDDVLRFQALHGAALASLEAGRRGDARHYLEQALEAAPDPGDEKIAQIRLLLGLLYFETDELAPARDHLAASLDLQEASGDTAGQALTRNFLGKLALRQGAQDEGVELVRKAAQQWRELGDDRAAANALREFGKDLESLDPVTSATLIREAAARSPEQADAEAAP